ncbi:hypothetical protein ATANTOWER_008925 [Ataeniobius toweri]|uniref:Uncharacterized protein n=1 Tax=Ataeniobius toweri TaxID=208326 RepID=A0ABU7B631_9TELE|nr:hypothetical protein [Ataeniobius toweri]
MVGLYLSHSGAFGRCLSGRGRSRALHGGVQRNRLNRTFPQFSSGPRIVKSRSPLAEHVTRLGEKSKEVSLYDWRLVTFTATSS